MKTAFGIWFQFGAGNVYDSVRRSGSVSEARAAVAALVDHLAEVEFELARRVPHGLARGDVDRFLRE